MYVFENAGTSEGIGFDSVSIVGPDARRSNLEGAAGAPEETRFCVFLSL